MLIGSGAEKRAVIGLVWNSAQRKAATGSAFIFDGNKLAWSTSYIEQVRTQIDLDAEKGKTRRDSSNNTFRLTMKYTKKIDIGAVIQGFLSGQLQMCDAVLEAVMAMEHILQETPSHDSNLVTFRRQYYPRDARGMVIGGGIEAKKGIRQTIRLGQGMKLLVSLDVANTCFRQAMPLTVAIINKNKLRDVQNIIADCTPREMDGSTRPSDRFKLYESDIRKLRVVAKYAGMPEVIKHKQFIIKGLTLENARQRMIEIKNKETGAVERTISIYDYFRKQYNLVIQYPTLPLVEMTKKGVLYPMEMLHLVDNQRYFKKLDENETANMIKFAVTEPKKRQQAIEEGKGWLNWANDQVHKHFGLNIDSNMVRTEARLLPAPGVKFGNKIEQPGIKGRWDLRGKKFLVPNPTELTAWGIGVFTGRVRADKGAIDGFVAGFTKAYRELGGKVNNQPPHIMQLPNDPGRAVEQLHQATGNKYQRRPQLLVFLVQDKNSFHYTRIKKSCDCRYGVVSQVMQIAQVLKGNPQYYCNVLMKVNGKLGGLTASSEAASASGFKGFKEPTMFIGADVSHASPGSYQASMAAITVSFDRIGGRYAAGTQTNGHRVEIISESNWNYILKPLASQWVMTVGGGQLPTHVYYFRDGVSEAQYTHVLKEEVPAIISVLSSISNAGEWKGKLTVVIASKRHSIRCFPVGRDAADARGNPLPGVMIERDVTTPTDWDFYLYSHTALQGTSRPVHYAIIRDDANVEPNRIQNMIYEHCYQYIRSTTSVSMFPAVYYAHLASNRARAHEDIPATEGPRSGAGFKQNAPTPSDPPASESKPLMPLFNANGIVFAMWYI